jgi:hypothetical protein
MSDRTGGIRVLAFTGCGACCRLRPAQNPHVWAGATPPFGGLSRPRGSLPPKPQGIRQSHVRLVMCADREPRTVHQVSHMSTRSDRLMGFIQCQVKPPGRARPQVQGAPRTAATGCRLGEIVPPCSVASQVRRSAPPLRAPSATWTRPARGSRVALVVSSPEDLEERQVRNIPTRLVVRRRRRLCGFRTLPAVAHSMRRRARRTRTCARKWLRPIPLHLIVPKTVHLKTRSGHERTPGCCNGHTPSR